MTDAAGNDDLYGYDATGQLTQVTLPGGRPSPTSTTRPATAPRSSTAARPTSYTSNADNEITQVGSTTYTYDANGNLHTVTDASGTTTYTYNDLNQLVSITARTAPSTTFQYSPLGFLVGETTSDGTQTNYLVDPTGLGNVVASYNGSGSLIADYTYGLGLVSQTGPGGTGYYDFDASGNTVGITGVERHLRQPVQLPAVRRDDDRLGGAAEPVHLRRAVRRDADRHEPVRHAGAGLHASDGAVPEQRSDRPGGGRHQYPPVRRQQSGLAGRRFRSQFRRPSPTAFPRDLPPLRSTASTRDLRPPPTTALPGSAPHFLLRRLPGNAVEPCRLRLRTILHATVRQRRAV